MHAVRRQEWRTVCDMWYTTCLIVPYLGGRVYSIVDADQGFAMAWAMEKLTAEESNAYVVIKGV